MEKKKLTPKQELFCKEYIIDFNATRAAKEAGYSEKTAFTIASENLKKPYIQNFIKELTKKREERLEVTADMVIQELAKMAFADIRDLYDDTGRLIEPFELSDNAAASVSSFKVTSVQTGSKDNPEEKVIEEYKRYNKEKTLELLGRHFGLFNDKIKVEGEFNLTNFVKTLHDERS